MSQQAEACAGLFSTSHSAFGIEPSKKYSVTLLSQLIYLDGPSESYSNIPILLRIYHVPSFRKL